MSSRARRAPSRASPPRTVRVSAMCACAPARARVDKSVHDRCIVYVAAHTRAASLAHWHSRARPRAHLRLLLLRGEQRQQQQRGEREEIRERERRADSRSELRQDDATRTTRHGLTQGSLGRFHHLGRVGEIVARLVQRGLERLVQLVANGASERHAEIVHLRAAVKAMTRSAIRAARSGEAYVGSAPW